MDGHRGEVGVSEEPKVSRERKATYEALRDENRPLSPAEVGKLLLGRQKGYEAAHKNILRIANDGQITRIDRGRYLGPQGVSRGRI